MASLEGVLARVPGLGGYVAGQQMGQRDESQKLAQLGALQQIMQRQQQAQAQQAAMQEQAQLQGVVQQAGGDPTRTIDALMRSGNPKAIELATKMKAAFTKPEGQAIGSGGLRLPDGTVIPPSARPTDTAKPPTMRTRVQGETQVQEEYQPDGTWKEVGKGPRFAKQVAPNGGGMTLHTQGQLDPEAVKDLAIQSLYDPMSLSGYRRDPKMMAQIANQRVKLMKESGVTSEDVVAGRAGFKADTASLNKITPQYDAITAFEKTAIRNGKILITLADKVDTTGVPALERWIRAGRKELAGDPDVAKLNAQMNLYRAEAARILTQPNLSGILTDTARKEMEEVLQNSATAQQVRETVGLLERDFLNRKETLEEQIGAIRTRMRSRASPGGADAVVSPSNQPAPAAVPVAPKVRKYNPTTGALE